MSIKLAMDHKALEMRVQVVERNLAAIEKLLAAIEHPEVVTTEGNAAQREPLKLKGRA